MKEHTRLSTMEPPPPLDANDTSHDFGMSGRDMAMFWLDTVAVIFLCMALATLAWRLMNLYLGGLE